MSHLLFNRASPKLKTIAAIGTHAIDFEGEVL